MENMDTLDPNQNDPLQMRMGSRFLPETSLIGFEFWMHKYLHNSQVSSRLQICCARLFYTTPNIEKFLLQGVLCTVLFKMLFRVIPEKSQKY